MTTDRDDLHETVERRVLYTDNGREYIAETGATGDQFVKLNLRNMGFDTRIQERRHYTSRWENVKDET